MNVSWRRTDRATDGGRTRREEGDGAVALDRASVLPATLAAVAEGAVVFLPLRALATDAVGARTGPLVVYPVFLVVLAGAVAVATALRRFQGLPVAVAAGAVTLGLLQGLVWGRGSALETVAAVVLMLAVGFRVMTLALRDWREPIRFAFGAGAAALLVEVLIATGGTTNWRSLLGSLIAQFFVAGLASRAASLRLDRHPATETVGSRGPRRWLRSMLVLVASLGLLLTVAFLFGRRGGVLQLVGDGVYRLGIDLIGWMAFVLAKILLGPFNWAVRTVGLRLTSLQKASQSLQAFRRTHPHRSVSPQGQVLSRLFGLLFFVLLAVLLVRTMRRQRQFADRYRPSDLRPLEVVDMPFGRARARRRRRQLQRELPEDTIRRWYAQTLLVLERRGVAKAPSLTPDEYLVEVVAALPACAAEFAVLTRAYDDVRYGNRSFDRGSIQGLEPHRALLMQTLRKAPKEATKEAR